MTTEPRLASRASCNDESGRHNDTPNDPRYLMGLEGTLRSSRYPDHESSEKTGPWFLSPRPLSWSDWVMPPKQVPPETTNFEFFSKDQTPAAKAQ